MLALVLKFAIMDSSKANKLSLKGKIMKLSVRNMTSSNGNLVPNQFVIDDGNKTVFQSYRTIIAVREKGKVILDSNALEYSNTTLKYLKQFLNTNESKKALYSRIENGYYSTADLN